MRVLLLAAALAATPTLCAAQLDDPDPSISDGGVVTDRGAAAPAAGGVTPDIAATVRGQTTIYTKPLTPAAPQAPQGPRRPVLLTSPGSFATPQGPAGPQGLPR